MKKVMFQSIEFYTVNPTIKCRFNKIENDFLKNGFTIRIDSECITEPFLFSGFVFCDFLKNDSHWFNLNFKIDENKKLTDIVLQCMKYNHNDLAVYLKNKFKKDYISTIEDDITLLEILDIILKHRTSYLFI